MMSPKIFTFLGFLSTALGAVMLAVFVTPRAEQPEPIAVEALQQTGFPTPTGEVAGATEEVFKAVSAFAVPKTDGQFDFTLSLPATWEVQTADRGDALLVFDPTSQGDTASDKSQLYIQRFTSDGFPDSVFSSIANSESILRGDRRDVRASATVSSKAIPKDAPAWLSERHLITGIQQGDVLYTISKRPYTDARIYERILDSVTLSH